MIAQAMVNASFDFDRRFVDCFTKCPSNGRYHASIFHLSNRLDIGEMVLAINELIVRSLCIFPPGVGRMEFMCFT